MLLSGTERERNILSCEDEFYKNMWTKCSRQQICVDTFLFGGQYTDVASLAALSKFTAGMVGISSTVLQLVAGVHPFCCCCNVVARYIISLGSMRPSMLKSFTMIFRAI